MIETERLILREWRDADRDIFLKTCNTSAVTRFLGGQSTDEQLDAAIARIRACQAANGHCFWAIERRNDRSFLGYCGLKIANRVCPAIEGEIEIGWRLSEDAWGQGYAREAAETTLAWAWANLDAPRIVAMTVPANTASWGLMERLGMTRHADLDFAHPVFAADHPLSAHIVYAIDRPHPR
ncbi:GNAT family N-acetyltransferase [Sphingomonas bacterium]|uniref:GNAT family N-acetyltransferase n=1 Tax=Sphingomonas bacterium TaxID=1895847 RepID=UPI00157640D1|nr:GNAT family N-acetyltransferase [Sphingomonas bacterium]